ncbi:MAG: AMP-binding protein [Acidimicrobiia bacterium]|nr:AMP-binding protein [Acidimicrobiia bacterium]
MNKDAVTGPVTRAGLGERIGQVLAIDPSAGAIEFDGRWHTWGALGDTARVVAAAVEQAGTEVGVVLRNHPASVGTVLGVLLAGGCVVAINPGRGRDRTRDDITSLDLPVLAGHPDDLAELAPDDSRATTIAVAELGGEVTERPGSDPDPGGGRPGVAVRMLTSGTTGPPKRIDLTYETFEKVLVGAKHYESGQASAEQLRTGVAIVNAPLAHVAGMFRVLQCATDGRPFALLERFSVEGWLDAVRRHQPKTTSLVPTALRMVLDADLDPADLASLKSVISGTAPLDPEDADAFYRKYGVPVLISYGATEFAGGVAGWNIHDHREFWDTKKGSVGRAHAGCELKVVDADTGDELPPDAEGVLHVKAGQLPGHGWVETTDLARIDDDGFLFIIGRADQAVIRGGFKVIPDTVRAALERHPSVRGAAVVGRDDRRLGAVPVAAVELWPDADPVDADALLEHLGHHLARYELPTEIRVVDELPRTDSGKADLGAVDALLNEPDAGAS